MSFQLKIILANSKVRADRFEKVFILDESRCVLMMAIVLFARFVKPVIDQTCRNIVMSYFQISLKEMTEIEFGLFGGIFFIKVELKYV